MKIKLVNVPITDAIKNAIQEISAKTEKEIIFEDSIEIGKESIVNVNLIGEALKIAKVHAEVSVTKDSGYFVRDIASGVVNSEHNIIADNGMRIARDLIKYSEQDIERTVRGAIERAGAKRVLLVTKSNILITAKVFQRISSEVAVDYGAQVDFVEIEDFILFYNEYLKKYPLIIADSLIGDILSGILLRLGEIKGSYYVGESESFYTSDSSTKSTAIAIYELIKESDIELADEFKPYLNKFCN